MNHSFFADRQLSQRLERLEGLTCARFVEARTVAQPDRGACSLETGGTLAMFDGPGSPITQTFGLGMFEPVTPPLLDELEAFFRDRGSAVNHEVSPHAGIEVFAMLAGRGYLPVEMTSVMYRPIAEPLTGTLNPHLRVRIVQGDECDLWTEVNARGWATEAPELEDFLRDFGSVVAARRDSLNFLAELDGVPVAAGALALGDSGSQEQGGNKGGEVLLAGAATVPEGRGQGAQFALLDARLRFAAAHGYELAMMGAAPGSTSQRNAERQGFRIAYTRVKWSLPAE